VRCLIYHPDEDGTPGLIACGLFPDEVVEANRRRYQEELRALRERRARQGSESPDDPPPGDPEEHPRLRS
jgi:hypothetical protein